jgi:hypothetical protein
LDLIDSCAGANLVYHYKLSTLEDVLMGKNV